MDPFNMDRIFLVKQLGHLAGLELSDDVCEVLACHLQYVLDANERASMTAIRSFEEGSRVHVLDSLMVVQRVMAAPLGPVLDMGSGGGFPGIPIAVTTDRQVTLVDSVAKKMRIMQEYIDASPALAGNVIATAVRLELLGEWVPPGGFPVIVARALSALPSLVELAAPLLAERGHLVCMKGDLADVELERGNRAAAMLGLSQVACDRYTLPGGDERRAVVVYERIGMPSVRVPRRVGMAQRKPLA